MIVPPSLGEHQNICNRQPESCWSHIPNQHLVVTHTAGKTPISGEKPWVPIFAMHQNPVTSLCYTLLPAGLWMFIPPVICAIVKTWYMGYGHPSYIGKYWESLQWVY